MARRAAMTREALVDTLRAHDWRLSAAAASLGLSTNTFQQRLLRRGLDRDTLAALRFRPAAPVIPAAPRFTPDADADAYADVAAQVRALTEACVALAAQVTALQDEIDRERGISAHLAHKLETYAVEAAA